MAVDAKICGLTRPDDARLAVRHGATQLGVIFAGGPRRVDHATARQIVSAAGSVPVFGVFGAQPVQTILDTIVVTGIRGVQLHHPQSADVVARLVEAGVTVWQVMRFSDADTLHAELQRVGGGDGGLLVEPWSPGGGGQGVALPHALAILARTLIARRPMVLAGGLGPDTVADAIRLVGPEGVDVSSGVEIAPGVKDAARLVAFLEAVRAVRPAA